MKKKKAKINVVFVVVTVALLVVFIPIILALISTADQSVLECLNPSLPIWNESFQLCTNASGVGVVNESATPTGLTASQEALLVLIPTFLVIGFVFAFIKASELHK